MKEIDDKQTGVLDAINADDTSTNDLGVVADGQLGGDEAVRDEAPEKGDSIRDSIRKAIKTESKTDEEKAEERNRNLEKAREARKAKAVSKSNSVVDANKDALDKAQISTEDVSTDVSTSKSDFSKPPNGWTKEAKALWNELPEHIKQSVAKREKEASDGFKTYGDVKRKYDEIEAVLAPRREAIQRFGVSEAQTVDRLFQWMEALSGPNRINSWLALGQNFGLNLNEIVQRYGSNRQTPAANTNPAQRQQQQPQGTQIPDAVKSYVEGAMGQLNDYVARQRQESANEYLANWSKDKPHYQTVRPVMYGLLQSGSVPLKDGKLDLDTAYDYACNANPEVRAELAAQSQEKAEAKAAEDRKKAEADRIIRLNKAKQAGTSIKPTAPAGASKLPARKKEGQTPSARDSIRDAISELVSGQ